MGQPEYARGGAPATLGRGNTRKGLTGYHQCIVVRFLRIAVAGLGKLPSADVLLRQGITSTTSQSGEGQSGQLQQPGVTMTNAMAAIIPLLSALPATDPKEKSESKPPRYLVSKGLPTLPLKLVEKVWALDFVDMEDFLPAPRALRLVEQQSSTASLQESLVGALSHFQAMQQQQKSQRKVLDTTTWVKCFTLYIATMAKKKGTMVPCMVAHMHTVLKLFQKAPDTSAWLEYDVQFRMEAAASEDREWSCGDPWQYVACLPGQFNVKDPFSVMAQSNPTLPDTVAGPSQTEPLRTLGKGKRPLDRSEGNEGRPPFKKSKKPGVCRLFNRAPGGCPYGRDCIFTHRCMNCGTANEHGALACKTQHVTPLRDLRSLQ